MWHRKNFNFSHFFFLCLLPLGILIGCSTIKYIDDKQFISSLEANSPEALIYLNSRACKNGDNEYGMCIFKLPSTSDIKIHINKQPYSYNMRLDCSDNVNADYSVDVLSNEPFDYTIDHKRYEQEQVMNCTVTVLPMDRTSAVGFFAAFRVFIVNPSYVSLALPSIQDYQGKKYLVFGQYAYHAQVDGKDYLKTTMIPYTGQKMVTVESYMGRINNVNF